MMKEQEAISYLESLEKGKISLDKEYDINSNVICGYGTPMY